MDTIQIQIIYFLNNYKKLQLQFCVYSLNYAKKFFLFVQESLSSNDVPEENIYSISVSKNTYKPNLESLNTNNIFEPEKPKPKNIPTYADYDEGNIFIHINLMILYLIY